MPDKDTEQKRTKLAKSQMLKALAQTVGIVTPALDIADVGRTTYYEWLSDDKEFVKAVDEVEDIALDHSESQLHKAIAKGEERSIHFHLDRKGSGRGYAAQQEIKTNFPPGAGINIYVPHTRRHPLP